MSYSAASDSTDSFVEPLNLSLMNFVVSSTSTDIANIGQSINQHDRKAFSCATPIISGDLMPHEDRLQKRTDLLQLFEIEPTLSSMGSDMVRHSTSALFSQRVQCKVEEFIDDYLLRISQQVRIPRYSHKILPKLPPSTTSTSTTSTNQTTTTNPTETNCTNNETNDMDEDFNSAANTDKQVSMDLLTYLQNKEIYETTNANRNKQTSRGLHQPSQSFGSSLGKFSRPKAATRVKEERMSAIITDTRFLENTYSSSSTEISTSMDQTANQSPSRKKLSIFGKPSPPPIPQQETANKTPTKHDPARDESKSPPTIEATPSSGKSQHSFSPIKIPRERIVGPHVVDFVCDMTYPNFQNASIVHLAAKYNHVDILQWLLECCCDDQCSRGSPTNETPEHSKKCKQRQAKLWSLQDKQEMTPLFYGVTGNDIGKAHDACVFLCSQPTVQEKQLNYVPDQHGNLPIYLALRRKDYDLCDMLQLFGAKLDITVGVGVLGESLLHGAFRECNMDMSEYICKYMPRLLLKKNQREEHALFACLRDYRTINTHSSNSSSNLLDLTERKTRTAERRKSSLVIVNKNTSGKYYLFLKDILSKGTTLFGTELFEKSLLMKNSFGNNILMQAVCYNDVDCVKNICKFLFEYTLKNPDKFKFVSSMVFDKDKDGKTILHNSMDFAVRMMNKKPDDFLPWLNGFEWLLTWLEQNFLCHPGNDVVVKTPLTLFNFLSAKDNSGKTAFDIVSNQDLTRSEWITIRDCMVQATEKWQKEKSISGSSSSLLFEMGEKQGLVSLLKNKFKRNK